MKQFNFLQKISEDLVIMKERFLPVVNFSMMMIDGKFKILFFDIESSSALSVDWNQLADKITPASKAELFLPVSHSARWPLEALVLQLSQPSSLCSVCYHAVSQQGSKPRS